MFLRRLSLASLLTISSLVSLWPASSRADDMPQPPQLAAPQRASLAGEYGNLAFGPAEVDRGGFSLPSPLAAPSERGALGSSPFPSYSPDAGISEWGIGWASTLSFTRTRLVGSLDYVSDDLTGPWGRMIHGSDGAYYGLDLSGSVRVDWNEPTITATLPSGDVMTFGGDARFVTAQGTYAWYLTDVVTVTGRRTHYAWSKNASGRPFLQTVQYGGHGTDYQYEIDFAYENTSFLFVSYQSGVENTLDQRVHQVTVRVKNGGEFDERWHYTFKYLEEGTGPAFWLQEVDQTFASGDTAPPVRYDYRLATDAYPARAFQRAPTLDAFLKSYGGDLLEPSRSARLDIDDDGRIDLEENRSNVLFHQTDAGWTATGLPAMPAGASALCRHAQSLANVPRLLSEGMDGTDATRVVGTLPNATHSATEMDLCERDGRLVSRVVLTGYWAPSANVKLVDVDHDRKPDLVRLDYGQVSVLHNQGTSGKLSFAAAEVTLLQPAFSPTATEIQDINGDGIPDLVARNVDTFVVWYGTGAGSFVREGQLFQLFAENGRVVGDFERFGFHFIDANRDGLMDILIASPGLGGLFINDGFHFVQVSVPALDNLGASAAAPVVADLVGSGNSAIAMTSNGQAWSLDLDDAGVGLMTRADDGRGNVATFTYGRAPAAPGAYQRHSVLASMTATSTGQDAVTYSYTYGQPVVHSQAKFLVGYGSVLRTTPQQSQLLALLNDDDVQGVLQSSRAQDVLTPSVTRYEADQYQAVTYNGVPWLRRTSVRNGYTDSGGVTAFEERTDYLAWEAEICPSQVQVTKQAGTLSTTTVRAAVPGMGNALHCLVDTTTTTGTHADARWNFTKQQHIQRNAQGLPLQLETIGPQGTFIESTVTYDGNYYVSSMGAPGRGTSTFAWDPNSYLLASTTGADGVVHRVVSRAPVSDQILQIGVDRGQLHANDFFRFDGQERLVKHWDDQGHANEQLPMDQLAYRYATATLPAAISSSTLVQAAAGSVARAVNLQTGAGALLGQASLGLEGWTFGPLTQQHPNQGETVSLTRDVMASSVDPTTIDVPTLFAGAQNVADNVASASGVAIQQATWFYPSQLRQVSGGVSLAGQLQVTATENGVYTSTTTRDAGGRMTSFTDAGGARWVYHYDAADRLRQVDMPDGAGQRVFYDGYGRASRIERDSFAIIGESYDPTSGLLTAQTLYAPDGTPMRGASFSYDGIGRKTAETYTDLASNSSQSFTYYWDGTTPTNPIAGGALGLLTAVTGDGFVKLHSYRGDGLPVQHSVELVGWQTVVNTIGYDDHDAPNSSGITVRRADGSLVTSTQSDTTPDAYGRVGSVSVNGAPLMTMSYDPHNGQLAQVAFSSGDSAHYTYDPLTRARYSETHTSAANNWTSEDVVNYNNRGLVGTEWLGIGNQSAQRSYQYAAAGYLQSSQDGQHSYDYDYDVTGLVTGLHDNGADTLVTRNGSVLTAGSSTYTLDSLGRTVSRDDLELTYGGNGQIAQAQRGADSWTFKYDEAGQRILKLHNGKPAAGYIGDAYLDDSSYVELLPVSHDSVGVLRNGVFELVPLDREGNVIGEPDGTQTLASPYGQRAAHGQLAAIVDYARKGYDADLGIVRMGVRDYDPALGRFLTPDPLFLASLEACAKSAHDCNLYGYAQGDPVNYVDPSGLKPGLVAAAEDALDVAPELEAPAGYEATAAAASFLAEYAPVGAAGYAAYKGLQMQNWNEPGMGMQGPPTDGGVPMSQVATSTSTSTETVSTARLASQITIPKEGTRPFIVYRGGRARPNDMTPRPKDVLGYPPDGFKRGLSTFNTIEKAAKPGDYWVAIDTRRLSKIEAIYDDPVSGHYSLRPADWAKLVQWGSFYKRDNGQTPQNPFTDEILKAIVGEGKRPKK